MLIDYQPKPFLQALLSGLGFHISKSKVTAHCACPPFVIKWKMLDGGEKEVGGGGVDHGMNMLRV